MSDSSWRSNLRRDTTKAREVRRANAANRMEPAQHPTLPLCLPLVRRYYCRLTLGAMKYLRVAVKDLFSAGALHSIFIPLLGDGEQKRLERELIEPLRLYCVMGLSIGDVAKVLVVRPSAVSKAVSAAFHILVHYAEPKPLRDTLMEIARGRRKPSIPWDEVQALQEGKRLPLNGSG